MSLQNRIEKLEQERESAADSGDDGFSRRWNEAYREIAETMDVREFAEVNAEIMSFLDSTEGNVSHWSSHHVLSFVASRVLSLANRAANGFRDGMMMPPVLAQAWREHDERLKDAEPDVRSKASFDCHSCIDCGAEHPFLGRMERNEAQKRRVIVNPDDLIKTCLLCGGVVGKRYGNGHLSATELAQ